MLFQIHISYITILLTFLCSNNIFALFSGRADLVIKLNQAYQDTHYTNKLCIEYSLNPKFNRSVHHVFPVRLKPGTDINSALSLLNEDYRIEYIEKDNLVRMVDNPSKQVQLAPYPDDTEFRRQWALFNPEQNRADMHVLEAWKVFTGSKRIVVGILDSGIDYKHPDLIDNMWHNPHEIPDNGKDDDDNGYVDDYYGWNFVTKASSPNSIMGTSDPMDINAHGTHVAGIVGASTNNSRGIAGVNHQVSLMALKGLGDDGWGFTSDLIAGIYYAVDNGAQIINASWGGGGYSRLLVEALKYARDHNVIFVAAAGNWKRDNDKEPFYPSSYDTENVVAVAASTPEDQLADFSHYGRKSVDLVAPGFQIMSTLRGGGYVAWNGTSMAAPQVAGALALLIGYAPELNYSEYISVLYSSVDKISALEDKVSTGGRVNIFKAISLITTKRKPRKHIMQYLTSLLKNNKRN